MKIIQLMKPLFAAATLALAASAPAHASLVGTYGTLYFSGTCTDCSGTAVANLNFSTYTIGTPLIRSHFFGFSYGGSNLFAPFTIDGDDQPNTIVTLIVTGSGFGSFAVHDDVHFFKVNSDGTWGTGLYDAPCTSCGGGGGSGHSAYADYGTNGKFSDHQLVVSSPPPEPTGDVPEPGSASLLFLGVGAMAGIHRRRSAGRATLKAAAAGN